MLSDSDIYEVSEVRTFVEKPNLKTAESFIEKMSIIGIVVCICLVLNVTYKSYHYTDQT